MSSSSLNRSYHVTAVISQHVREGRAAGYERWMKGIAAAAREFEGHLGLSVLRPQPGAPSNYVIVLQFDTCDHLQAWLKSDIRKGWLERVKPLVKENGDNIQILTGLESWFQLPSQSVPSAPKRYKQAMLVWIGVMGVSVVVSPWLEQLLAPLPMFLELPLTVASTVVLLTYIIMPRLTQWFRGWLFA
jgi:antibiotic biosynthesis monooxygenase (ABM) superfamily enzyme